jgi:protein TonB
MPIILVQATPPAAAAGTAGTVGDSRAAQPVMPDWRRKATGENLARVYPQHAQSANIEGRGVIRCDVTAEGAMANCVVVEETPRGEGFGEATLKLAKYFVMRPQTKDGVAVAGGSVTIPIVFRLP